MRKILTAALAVLSIGLFSCQKEVDDIFAGNGSGSGSSGELLLKTVAVTNSDTLTTLYSYDNQRRLETIIMDGTSNGILMHNYKKYIRDASSRIVKIVQVVDQNGIVTDTTAEIVHYPGSGAEYDYTVNELSVLGFTTKDSSVYSFSSGKMTSMTSHLSSPLLGPTEMLTKIDFTYDAEGNVTVIKTYSDLGTGVLAPVANESYTYGNAINSTWASTSGAQNFLLFGTPATGNKAYTKLQLDNLATPSNSQTITMTYNVGSDGKPISATATSSAGQVTKYSFYYQ